MKRRTSLLFLNGLLSLPLCALPAGCGGVNESNLSTKSSADAGKLAKAQDEADQSTQRSREAEATKYKGAFQVEKP